VNVFILLTGVDYQKLSKKRLSFKLIFSLFLILGYGLKTYRNRVISSWFIDY